MHDRRSTRPPDGRPIAAVLRAAADQARQRRMLVRGLLALLGAALVVAGVLLTAGWM